MIINFLVKWFCTKSEIMTSLITEVRKKYKLKCLLDNATNESFFQILKYYITVHNVSINLKCKYYVFGQLLTNSEEFMNYTNLPAVYHTLD